MLKQWLWRHRALGSFQETSQCPWPQGLRFSPWNTWSLWGTRVRFNNLDPGRCPRDSQDVAGTLWGAGSTNIEQPIFKLPTHSCVFRMHETWSVKYFDCKGYNLNILGRRYQTEAFHLMYLLRRGWKRVRGTESKAILWWFHTTVPLPVRKRTLIGLGITHYSFF